MNTCSSYLHKMLCRIEVKHITLGIHIPTEVNNILLFVVHFCRSKWWHQILQISSSKYSLALLLTVVQGKPLTTAEWHYFLSEILLSNYHSKTHYFMPMSQQRNLFVCKGSDRETDKVALLKREKLLLFLNTYFALAAYQWERSR